MAETATSRVATSGDESASSNVGSDASRPAMPSPISADRRMSVSPSRAACSSAASARSPLIPDSASIAATRTWPLSSRSRSAMTPAAASHPSFPSDWQA
jgi:hypothetical protein